MWVMTLVPRRVVAAYVRGRSGGSVEVLLLPTCSKDRCLMTHANAPLTPAGRLRLVKRCEHRCAASVRGIGVEQLLAATVQHLAGGECSRTRSGVGRTVRR